MQRVKKEFWENLLWSEEHYSELVEKFPEKWIAIVGKKIVAHGDSIKKVEEEAERSTGKDRNEIPVVFVSCGSNIYILDC